jgi:hypothetical protein
MPRVLLMFVLALPDCAPPASMAPPATIQYVMVERSAPAEGGKRTVPEPSHAPLDPEAPARRPILPSDPLSFDQSTPRAAVWSLVHAFEKGHWNEVLRLVPDDVQAHDALTEKRLREAWEGPMAEEVQRKIRAVRRALGTAEVEQDGDRAELHYAQGTVQLVREHGDWKVRDF